MDGNFIEVYDDVVPADYCKSVIERFEVLDKMGLTFNRQKHQGKLATQNENDIAHLDDYISSSMMESNIPSMSPFIEYFWECYRQYEVKYGILSSLMRHNMDPQIQIQRVKPSQGYHMWHCEQDGAHLSRRMLVPLLYLNDVEEGGETEFLYQSVRVKPKTGRMVIFPAAFTHTHRGNPPLSGIKYIMTSWVDFVE